jgi:hypothetical protein
MDVTSVRLRAQDLDWRELDDEIVVLDGRGAMYSAVRGSGTLLWRLLAEETTRGHLVAAMVDTYDVDVAQAADDVDAFLATLDERGLLAA